MLVMFYIITLKLLTIIKQSFCKFLVCHNIKEYLKIGFAFSFDVCTFKFFEDTINAFHLPSSSEFKKLVFYFDNRAE